MSEIDVVTYFDGPSRGVDVATLRAEAAAFLLSDLDLFSQCPSCQLLVGHPGPHYMLGEEAEWVWMAGPVNRWWLAECLP